jgi:hypothetical protein
MRKSLTFSQFLVDAGRKTAIVLKGSPDEEIAVRRAVVGGDPAAEMPVL